MKSKPKVNVTARALGIGAALAIGLYVFCCPMVNEGLYQKLAVMPTRFSMDMLNPYRMGKYVGQHVFIPVSDKSGRVLNLHGVYFANKYNRGTVIFSLGNSGCLSSMLGGRQQMAILDLGYNLLVYEYEGFGDSQGDADYKTLGRDGIAAYNYAHDKLKAGKVILYGLSMGAGVSAFVASEKHVEGVVLDSPFISPEVTIKKWFPPVHAYPSAMFPQPRYDNREFLKAKHPPTLILIKGQDETLGADQGIVLRDIAAPPTRSLLLPKSAHAYIHHEDDPAFLSELKSFLNSLNSAG